jgi:hypothetical protein
MGANKKVETLEDVVRHKFELGIRCWCGHVGTISARDTVRWFVCHGWDTRVSMVGRHLWCSGCRRRRPSVRIGISAGTPVDWGRYPRDEDGWKQLVKRLRG